MDFETPMRVVIPVACMDSGVQDGAALAEFAERRISGSLSYSEKTQLKSRAGITSCDASGTTREIYTTNAGTVVKLPKHGTYREYNEWEVSVSESCSREDLFVPVLDSGRDGWWLEMRECSRTTEGLHALKQRLQNAGYKTRDFIPSDVVLYNGVAVLADYGEIIVLD